MESNSDQQYAQELNKENFEDVEESKIIDIEHPANPERVAEKDSQLETAIYSQKFYCQDKKSVSEHTLSVTQHFIMIDNQESTNIFLQNIIGATVSKVSPDERRKLKVNLSPEKQLFCLTIHLYSKVMKSSFFGSKKAKREHFDLRYYVEDESIASAWRNLVLQAANNPAFIASAHKYKTVAEIPPFKRHLVVFVNPASGKGLAAARWTKSKPFLEKAGCTFTEVKTEYSGHARDYVQKLEASELLNYDGLVTVSGDGLPHEVINGLCLRSDWEEVKHIPLGPLPGGSGNAIVKNLLWRAGEETSLTNACYLIAKGKTTHSDLTVYEMPDKPRVYSFLSFVWAAMAKIDIESEKVRWLGALRFDVYGVFTILKNKTYRAKLTYSETNNNLPPVQEEIKGDEWKRIEDTWSYFNIHKMPYITEDCHAAPVKDFQDGYNHLVALKGAANTRFKMTKILLGLTSGFCADEAKLKKNGVYYDKMKSFRLETENIANNYYSIDGEKYSSPVIQGSIKEKALTLFCTK